MRRFEAAEVKLLVWMHREHDEEERRVDRGIGDSRQGFVATVQRNPIEPNKRQLGAESAAPGDDASACEWRIAA